MTLKKKVLERDNFTCQKCDFSNLTGVGLEVHHIRLKATGGGNESTNLIILCSICHYFAPNNEAEFKTYINEKVDGKILETYRKFNTSNSERTSFGMERKSKEGGAITKPPFGYKMINKKLEADLEDSPRVQQLFREYSNNDMSLNKLAKSYGLTVNGLKKVLSNRAYLGDVKFDGKTNKGIHQPLLNEELFNQVQAKLQQKNPKSTYNDILKTND